MAGKPGFNGLTPSEWTILSRSVFDSRAVSSPREKFHKEHGATFSVALAERAIKMYSSEDDIIFDPFLGTGTTVVAARQNERKSIGIELYERFAQIAEDRISQQLLGESKSTNVLRGNCLERIKEIEDLSIQLTFTSPPYADFIHRSVKDRERRAKGSMPSLISTNNNSTVNAYGESDIDFGNQRYPLFLESVTELMVELYRITKPGGYNVWVVKDHRDTKNLKPYIDVHSDIARCGEKAGFLHHDLIIWDQNEQRRLVLLGYPSVFYVNQNHSYLVVLRKPTEKQQKILDKRREPIETQ
jgi:DNA modification methylase